MVVELVLLFFCLRQNWFLDHMSSYRRHTTHSTCVADLVQLFRIDINFLNWLICSADDADMAIFFHGLDFAFKPVHKVGGSSGILGLGSLIII